MSKLNKYLNEGDQDNRKRYWSARKGLSGALDELSNISYLLGPLDKKMQTEVRSIEDSIKKVQKRFLQKFKVLK